MTTKLKTKGAARASKAPDTARKARKPPAKSAAPARTQSKTEKLINMMGRPGGATSKEMEQATGWAPHSVRGLIGALKKRDVNVQSLKEPGSPTRYVIAPKPAADIGDVV